MEEGNTIFTDKSLIVSLDSKRHEEFAKKVISTRKFERISDGIIKQAYDQFMSADIKMVFDIDETEDEIDSHRKGRGVAIYDEESGEEYLYNPYYIESAMKFTEQSTFMIKGYGKAHVLVAQSEDKSKTVIVLNCQRMPCEIKRDKIRIKNVSHPFEEEENMSIEKNSCTGDLSSKILQGFVRLSLVLLEEALEESPDNKALLELHSIYTCMVE